MKKDAQKIKAFSEQVRAVKSKLSYNHTDMGTLFNVSRDTYIKWYRGVSMPYGDRYDNVMRIIGEELAK